MYNQHYSIKFSIMILFLDFDGVLHPKNCEIDLFFCKTGYLWQLLDAIPELNVVFSTSWREQYSLSELVEMLCHDPDHECYRDRFISVTPVLKSDIRGNECLQWLRDNLMADTRHLAVDDRADWFNENCYIIDPAIGIEKADVENIINYFSVGHDCHCQF